MRRRCAVRMELLPSLRCSNIADIATACCTSIAIATFGHSGHLSGHILDIFWTCDYHVQKVNHCYGRMPWTAVLLGTSCRGRASASSSNAAGTSWARTSSRRSARSPAAREGATIDRDGIRTRNASRALWSGPVDLENLGPRPRTSSSRTSVFTQMGRSEELGSGTRNLYKFSRLYSGEEHAGGRAMVYNLKK